jgi:GxxExxY protein
MHKTKGQNEQHANSVVDAMLKVRRALGPGLLESAYQACLTHELRSRGVDVNCEVALPIRYGGIEIEAEYRIDMLMAECIIIANKSVQAVPPIHEAQLLGLGSKTGRRGESSSIGGIGRGGSCWLGRGWRKRGIEVGTCL